MAALELVPFSMGFPSATSKPSFSPPPPPPLRWRWNPHSPGLRLRLPRRPALFAATTSGRMPQLSASNSRPGLVPRATASSSSSREVAIVEEPKRERGALGGIVDAVLGALRALRKPAAAALLLGLLLAVDPYAALAASGGRMGGRSFSSSSGSSLSSSRSYSVPSGSAFSFSTPYYYAPSPFFGGGGGLYVGFGAGSGFFLLMAGFAAVVLLSGFLSDRSDDGSVLTATQKTSVLKLQVGLLGLARSFQKDLDRIAEAADTSTPEGLSYILTETTLALLRHPDCCISGYSSVDIKRSVEAGEKRFNQLSIEERGKFDEETLVNVNSIKRRSSSGSRSNAFSNEYIVVTILVAAEGVHKLPVINGGANLKEALQKLGSIPSSKIMAVEVLWTPQNENDSLSEQELLEDYPLLRPL